MTSCMFQGSFPGQQPILVFALGRLWELGQFGSSLDCRQRPDNIADDGKFKQVDHLLHRKQSALRKGFVSSPPADGASVLV
jgi:hypothetical protein